MTTQSQLELARDLQTERSVARRRKTPRVPPLRLPTPAEQPTSPASEDDATLLRTRTAPAGHRLCPEPVDRPTPLLQQSIGASTCTSRQGEGYHKCATCKHQSQPQFAGSELPPLENGPLQVLRAEREVEV